MGASGHAPPDKPNRTIRSELSQLKPIYAINDDKRENLYNSIPKDQYLCPLCGEIPELANIHTDNGCIEFKCRIDGELIFSVEQYFQKLSECQFTYYNIVCQDCNKLQKNYINKNEVFQYCYICKKDFCKDCVKKHPRHPEFHLAKCIPVNEKTSRCLEHFDDGNYTSFCTDCYKHVCNQYSTKEHRGHHKISLFKLEPQKKIIIDKNKILSDIIRFNELILNTYEKFPDNYFHILNMSNLANSIIAENQRNSRELESALRGLEEKVKMRKNAIEAFNKKFRLSLNGNEESLSLSNIGLDEKDLETMTQISFPRLKDLDISKNNIGNISSLKNLDTSNLESLKMNDNKIENIDVLESLNLTKLIELGLQNNNLKSVSPLLKSNLPVLELLRIEGNNQIDTSLNDFKKLVKKYSKKVIYITQTFGDLKKKYGITINEKSEKIDFRDKKVGNEILQDLYVLSSSYAAKTLNLSGCKISDISKLSRISFKNLETLDLSMNELTNIDALNKMTFKKLKYLYLNDNKISDIKVLKTLKLKKFTNLASVSLLDNNIVSDNQEIVKIIDEMKKSKVEIDIE